MIPSQCEGKCAAMRMNCFAVNVRGDHSPPIMGKCAREQCEVITHLQSWANVRGNADEYLHSFLMRRCLLNECESVEAKMEGCDSDEILHITIDGIFLFIIFVKITSITNGESILTIFLILEARQHHVIQLQELLRCF